jgi:copper chaperone CopZ
MYKKNAFLLALLLLMGTSAVFAQEKGMTKKSASVSTQAQTETFMVLGNCGMCEKTIEKAALSAGALSAEWNVDNDMLRVSFDPAKVSLDAIQKAIARAGYDNATYKADDKAYQNLHGCCHYERTGAAGGTKSCTEQ